MKLFRDYVFHQTKTPETQQPDLGIAHIAHCLNHLDAGSEERVVLMGRKEDTVLVVRYRDIKHILDSSYQELLSQSRAQAPPNR